MLRRKCLRTLSTRPERNSLVISGFFPDAVFGFAEGQVMLESQIESEPSPMSRKLPWRGTAFPGTRFALSVRGDFEDLGEQLNLRTYRLIQESLTNIYKHADAVRDA